MKCERRSFILSMVLCAGLASSLMAQDVSITEICSGLLDSEGAFAGFNADTVVATDPSGDLSVWPDPSVPTPTNTTPARVGARETFCTRNNGPFNNNTCQRTGRWSVAIGDDFPLNGLGNQSPNPGGPVCDYRTPPLGGFPVSTVGDWSGATQYCMLVRNCDNTDANPEQRNSVAARALMFTSLGNVGVALQIRTFAQSGETWIGPGVSATVCIDFDNAQVEPTLAGGQTVPNLENVTGFGFEFGAFTPFTEQRSACWDADGDNDPADCLNARPNVCTEGSCGNDPQYLNRESDDVCVTLEQPRPRMDVNTQNLVFCNSGFMSVNISNPGTGTLFITKANLGGANPNEFEAQQTLAVPAGENRNLTVRYNNREVGRHSASLTFESNALTVDNTPVNHSLPEFVVDLHAFSTLAQTIDTEQNTATQFTARTILHISEHAPTGRQLMADLVGDENGLVNIGPADCGKVTQIASISSRYGFDASKIVVTSVEVGRPSAEPNGAVSGIETVEPPVAPLPCCVTDNSDPPLNVATEWQILYQTDTATANAQQRLDCTVGDIGGTVIDTEFYTNNFPLQAAGAPSDRHVLVEAFSADFELLSLTGCNTATVFFVQGPSDNFFPANHQSNVGHNPDQGTTVLQDTGANSARSLGIPPNSFVRGDVDFSAQPNANDIVRMADVIFNTDGSEAQVATRIGRQCVAAVDLTVDKSIDIRDLLTLIQLLFNITSNVTPSDVIVLQDRQVAKATDLGTVVAVGWPGAGYERQVPNTDTTADDVRADPNRFTCAEGLDCEE